jgi:hypothetical protein
MSLMLSVVTLLILAISQGLFLHGPIVLRNRSSVRLLELELFRHCFHVVKGLRANDELCLGLRLAQNCLNMIREAHKERDDVTDVTV